MTVSIGSVLSEITTAAVRASTIVSEKVLVTFADKVSETVTVYIVTEDVAVGVPVMAPDAEAMANPAGRAGRTP